MTLSNTAPDEPELRPARGSGSPAQPQFAEAELRLPRPPGLFRSWLAAHPRFVDGFIVGAYLCGCGLMILAEFFALTDIDATVSAGTTEPSALLHWPRTLVVIFSIAVVALALSFRRRYPLLGVIAISLTMLLGLGLLATPNAVALVFLLYAAPVYRSVATGWAGFGIALAITTGALTTDVLTNGSLDWQDAMTRSVINALWLLAVVLFGIDMGNRRRYVGALIDRAHQLAREREQQAQLAASAERARIAREMHDVVAHSLSVVVTLSEAAAATVEKRPEQAKQASERAAETGRAALVEMRRLLGVLRNDAAGSDGDDLEAVPLAPQPGLAQLQELVTGFREAGLSVHFVEEGRPVGDGGQHLALYRIVQEALTNALRYAGPGAAVSVQVLHGAQGAQVEVTDGGPVARSERRAPIEGSGLGLTGTTQRAEMFGGSLTAGPHGSGWRVIADIPSRATQPAGAHAGDTMKEKP